MAQHFDSPAEAAAAAVVANARLASENCSRRADEVAVGAITICGRIGHRADSVVRDR